MQTHYLETSGFKPFLTVDEAAAYLNISRSSMYNRIKSGDIAAIRIGRLIRIPGAALSALVVDSRDLSTLGPPADPAANAGRTAAGDLDGGSR